jgi:hypothetical protein
VGAKISSQIEGVILTGVFLATVIFVGLGSGSAAWSPAPQECARRSGCGSYQRTRDESYPRVWGIADPRSRPKRFATDRVVRPRTTRCGVLPNIGQ